MYCKHCGELLGTNDIAMEHAGTCPVMTGDFSPPDDYQKEKGMDKENIEGLKVLIDRMENVSKAAKGYADRHKRLLEDMEKDKDYDPLECLPGLMYVKHDLIESLREAKMPHILKRALEDKPPVKKVFLDEIIE